MFTVLLLICLCKSKFENDAGYCLVVAYKIHRICTPNVKSSFLQVKKTIGRGVSIMEFGTLRM